MDLSENPLLDSAWTAQIGELFADELRDLTSLEEEEEVFFAEELQHLRERFQEEFSFGSSRIRSPPCSPDISSQLNSARDKMHVQKPVRTQTHRSNARDMAQLLKEREAACVRARDHRPWRMAVDQQRRYVQTVRAISDAHRSAARRHQRFFSERGMDEYAMNDIIAGASEENALRPTSAEVVGPIGTAAQLVDGSSILAGRSSSTAVAEAGQEDFLIDGVAFARDMNATLENAYGFCPVLMGLSVPTPFAAEPIEKSLLMEQMRTHAPGDVTDVPEAPWIQKTTTLPMIVSQTAAPCASEVEPVAVGDQDESTRFPTLQEKGRKRQTAKRTSLAAADPFTESKKKKKAVSQSTIPLIECSAPDARVKLRTTVGVETSTTVRFINRGAAMLRFRVRPSSHTWVTYALVDSSLGVPKALRTKTCRSSSSSGFSPSTASTQLSLATDRPLRSGGYADVRIAFGPLATTEPIIEATLQLGYCREVNSRNGDGAQWSFFDVHVQCETVMPTFRLIPLDFNKNGNLTTSLPGSFRSTCLKKSSTKSRSLVSSIRSRGREGGMSDEEGVDMCEFPCTLVMSSFTRCFHLKNTGSDAFVTLQSSTPYFCVDPKGPVHLPSGEYVNVSLHFAPLVEAFYDSEVLSLLACETEGGPVVVEYRFTLRGEAVLPHVFLARLGSQELRPSLPFSAPKAANDSVAQLLVPETVPNAETNVCVVVHNARPLSAPFHWRVNIAGALDLRISPETGTLAPHQDTTFSVWLRPGAATPAVAALNLFLEGLPEPTPSILEEASSSSTTNDCLEPALNSYSRKKMILAVPDHDVIDLVLDPCSVFAHRTQVQPGDISGVFATGFYLFTDPVPPLLVLIPDRIEEVVECLVFCENVRRMALQNDSPRPLHFCFDPMSDDCPSDVTLVASSARDRDGVELDFTPRKGVLPPHSTLDVTVSFTLRTVGMHAVEVDCYVPELVELLPRGQRHCTHHLFLHATGVGPSVRASIECLDFGLIELGSEAETFFTITNDNPIPVVFELRDPVMPDPPRFVFLPSSIRLGAGESVEVTVYHRGIDVGVSQSFFEVAVQGGGVLVMVARATVQTPALHLHSAVVNFGDVPENVCVEKNFTLSNHSAFDISYAVHCDVVPPWVVVDVPPSGTAYAGKCGILVPVRCVFQRCNESDGNEDSSLYTARLRIASARTSQEFDLELRCDCVVPLGVAVDLISIPRGLAGEPTARSYDAPSLPLTLPSPPCMETHAFLRSLLWNLVTLVLSNQVAGSNSSHMPCDSSLPRSAAPSSPLPLQAYCPPMELRAELPDGEPVWHELIGLRVSNQTGCESMYAVHARHFAVADLAATLEASTPFSAVNGSKKSEKTDFNKRVVTRPVLSRKSASAKGSRLAQFSQRNVVDKSGPAFWCRSVDGSEQRERVRRAALVSAQQQLLDGRGCATVFGEGSNEAPLHAYEVVDVPVALFANLPGRYDEMLRLRCGDLPCVDVPVSLDLFGKPVLLDSTTAGLTVVDSKETLLMPAAIAGIGRSRRTFSLLNRVPRDLQVSVRIFLTPSTFAVVAVEDDEDDNIVTLRLQPVSAEAQEREFKGKGRVAATPDTFFLPAMASREVAMEYAPDAAFLPLLTTTREEGHVINGGADGNSGDVLGEFGSSLNEMVVMEKEWRGGVIITAELADTAFNDAFLIDEFYRRNSGKYRARRVLKSKGIGEKAPAWSTSVLRPIAMLRVEKPLLSRPGILANNNIVPATKAEMAVLKKELLVGRGRSHRTQEGEFYGEGVKCGAPHTMGSESLDRHSACSKACNKRSISIRSGNSNTNVFESVVTSTFTRGSGSTDNESSGDDDEKGEGMNESPIYRSSASLVRRPIESILADERERDELRTFLARRREDVVAHSRRCFTPIELDLRARVGAARLAVDPCGASGALRFPPLLAWQRGLQSLRLTNPACAALEFLLNVSGPGFAISATAHVAACGPDADWARAGAKKSKSSAEDAHSGAAGEEVAFEAEDGSVRHATRYRLLPGESLDVTLEFSADNAHAQATRHADAIEGALHILFLSTEERHVAISHRSSSQQQRHYHLYHHQRQQQVILRVPVMELEQCVPLIVTMASPSVSCIPSLLHFRPGQLIHDGRQQLSYVQRLTLQSSYPFDVPYEIVSIPYPAEGSRVVDSASITPVGALTSERQLREVRHYWDEADSDSAANDAKTPKWKPTLVVDANRFTIKPRSGVIPAVKQGGRAGTVEISVEFTEHSNVRFEASFCVLINGERANGGAFTVVGESRETEV